MMDDVQTGDHAYELGIRSDESNMSRESPYSCSCYVVKLAVHMDATKPPGQLHL